MYFEMPQDEREAWNQRAEIDKERYLSELNEYVPPPGYAANGDAIESALYNMSKNRMGTKATRDANAPKRCELS